MALLVTYHFLRYGVPVVDFKFSKRMVKIHLELNYSMWNFLHHLRHWEQTGSKILIFLVIFINLASNEKNANKD